MVTIQHIGQCNIGGMNFDFFGDRIKLLGDIYPIFLFRHPLSAAAKQLSTALLEIVFKLSSIKKHIFAPTCQSVRLFIN